MNQELEMKFQELTDFGKLECGFRSDWLSGNEKTCRELADLKEKAMYSKSESEIQSILKQADQLVKDACSVYLAETPKRLIDEISQNQNTLHDATIELYRLGLIDELNAEEAQKLLSKAQ